MKVRRWWVLSMLALPALGCAQAIKESDMVGGWRIQRAQFANTPEGAEQTKQGHGSGWLVLWPDHVWLWGAPALGHGASRWRLVGDTLWLAYDWSGYYQGENGVDQRAIALIAEGHGIGVIDTAIMRRIQPSRQASGHSATGIPDSVFWSPAFRDTTHFNEFGGISPTLVYKVTRNADRTLSLIRLEAVSRTRDGGGLPVMMQLQRDTLPVDKCLRMVDTTGAVPPAFHTRREWLVGVAWGYMHDDGCH